MLSPDCILTPKDSELGSTDKGVLVTIVKHISKAYVSNNGTGYSLRNRKKKERDEAESTQRKLGI